MPSPNLPPGFDFTDPAIYAERLPVAEFAELRSAAPIWWNGQDPGKGGGFHDGGFWAITTRYRGIATCSPATKTG